MYLKALPPTQTLHSIPDGRAGVGVTLQAMSDKVKAGKADPYIRALAYNLVSRLRSKDWRGEINALFEHVRDNIRYVKDINGIETVADAVQVMKQGQGDCDDKSVLLASMLESIGHPTRFKAVGFKPGELSHVYVETRLGDKWIPLETTENVRMGWKVPGVQSFKLQHN